MQYKTPKEILLEINTKYNQGIIDDEELRTVMNAYNEYYVPNFDNYKRGNPAAKEQIERFYEISAGIVDSPKDELEAEHSNTMGH